MPTSYAIDPCLALVVSRWRGTLTDADIRELRAALLADRAFDPTFRHLIDLREVARLDASAVAIAEVARAGTFAPGARRTLVVPESAPVHYGMARMFQAYCELAGSEVEVFSDLAAAEEWLGLPAGAAVFGGGAPLRP